MYVRRRDSLETPHTFGHCCFNPDLGLLLDGPRLLGTRKNGISHLPNALYGLSASIHVIEVHANTLNKLGRTTKAPEFEAFVNETLKKLRPCPNCWKYDEPRAGYGKRHSVLRYVHCT